MSLLLEEVETVIRCYAFIARWHRDHCDHIHRNADPPPISAALGESSVARREASLYLSRALDSDLTSPLVEVARRYEMALRTMWSATTHEEREAAQIDHRAAEARLFAAVCA